MTIDLDDRLCWLDLETTGSDATKDCIIELGAVITTTDLSEVDRVSYTISPTPLGLGRMMQNSTVRSMHEANGLLDAVLHGTLGRDLFSINDVIARFPEWLRMHGAKQGRTVLAGSGVGHFDRRFLDHWMPPVTNHFRYWVIDVGVIRRAYEMWTGVSVSATNDTKTHRALDDALLHLSEARLYRDLWASHA